MKLFVLYQMLFIFLLFASCSDGEVFTDKRDGQNYSTVKIGNQIIMAENLNFKTEKGSYDYNDDPAISKNYGRLYNWKTACEACPKGWHLPSDEEWTKLIDHLGGDAIAGGKIKDTGTNQWETPNTKATNMSGFTARPAGYGIYTIVGQFENLGKNTYYWSSTKNDKGQAWVRTLDFDKENVKRDWFSPSGYVLSVRCFKN